VLWPSGEKSLIVRYRRPDSGKSAKFSLGWIPLAAARKAAGDVFEELHHGRDPGEAKQAARAKAAGAARDTVQAVCEEYMAKAGVKLRSHKERDKILKRLVYPNIGSRPISSVRKIDCIRLFEKIATDNGPVMADVVRGIVSRIFNWHEGRHDEFTTPITPSIEKQARSQDERARTRTLSDDEIRAVWAATDEPGPFPALVRFLLLTGARLQEAARLPHAEITNSDWLLPAERCKTKRELLRPLSPEAKEILNSQPVVDGCPYFFTADGRKPMRSFSRAKKKLERSVGASERWTLHDLRRTARSLMSRAGVISDHAEQCLGHVLPGMRRVYDRHHFYGEKKLAFEKLAAQLELILNPPADNVVPMRG
jgi:integrase